MSRVRVHVSGNFGARWLGCGPHASSAADLGGYEERNSYVERPVVGREGVVIERPVVECERVIVEHRYYEPGVYAEEPEVTFYTPRYYRYHYAGFHRFAGFTVTTGASSALIAIGLSFGGRSH
jgi:hypothetical protein